MSKWHICGPYFESCNCEPICPCRRVDGQMATGVPVCQFALGWSVEEGRFDDVDLSGRSAVMVGYWDDARLEGAWWVGLYVDAEANERQRRLLAGILTGQHGGTPAHQYAPAINDVLFVEPAEIAIDHSPGRQVMTVRGHVDARARERFRTESTVSCGIPGHDRSGYEVLMEGLTVRGHGLDFSFEGNCGFAASFDYRSD